MLYGGMEHVTWRSVNASAVFDVPATAKAIVNLVLGGLRSGGAT